MEKQKVDILTNREIEILKLLKTGISNQAIADELGISINTVKTHLKHLFVKLKVKSRFQLFLMDFEGLI